MWDAYNGKLRCSYRGYNAVDEVESAFSVIFSADTTSVIGGYRKDIKIFKTDIPGRDYDSIPVRSPVSALACDTGGSVIAAGSWTNTITVFDARQSYHEQLCQMDKHRGGITYLRFMNSKGLLISGARKDSEVLVWDMRDVTEPIGRLQRTVNTNQRIYFDISRDERWLISGDTSGCIRTWNFSNMNNIEEETVRFIHRKMVIYYCEKDSKSTIAFGIFQYNLHHDCCNGVSMHPTRPILATSSGQHHFNEHIKSSDDECVAATAEKKPRENALIFWWCGQTTENIQMD